LDIGLSTNTLINYAEKGGSLTFTVRVVPRATRSEIVGEHDGALRVRIAAPPVDGAANKELLRLLACALHVSRSAVEITAGHTSKVKTVTVVGVCGSDLEGLQGKGQTF
jgi:uncharacterized protein (TIGR00251 family)